MKIGVISDTHLREVSDELKRIEREHLSCTDLVLHAGDVVSAEVVRFFKRRNFRGVHGNMDPPEVRSLLPEKEIIELGRYRLGLIHGWGASRGLEDRIAECFQGVDIIVYGHSHEPANHVKSGILFFNPGTATGYSGSGLHTLGMLELNDRVHGEIIPL